MNKLKILLIEDNPEHQDLFKECLALSVYSNAELSICSLMAEGEKLLQSEEFNLLFMDLSLPDSSMFETLESIRNMSGFCPVIVITSLDDNDVIMGIIERGADDCLPKIELSVSTIQRSIRYSIDRRKLLDELSDINNKKLESIGLLAGGIAHDFNNILTGIFGNIQLAKMKMSADHQAFGHIQTANKALEKATHLTSQLLTFSKGGEPILEIINIGDIIRESVKFSLSDNNVETTLDIAADLWRIKADKGQLSQVITNLLINANQAMQGKGSLLITAENIKNKTGNSNFLSNKYVKLRFFDNGVGIQQTHLDKIFEPYFTTKRGGNGLGLATAYSIIKRHKGQINVESKPDIGTTFTIFLPADLSITDAENVTNETNNEIADIKTGHILVMDDEEMILDLSKDMLEDFGFTVDTALDGNEAVDKYITADKTGDPFDVVVMDLTIVGGMGGKDAVKQLLDYDPLVKVIVSSGYSNDPTMAEYRKYGFMGMVKKPYQMDELRKEISKLITNSS